MNLLIFGASGKTGREIVSQAVKQNHTVTAFVRNSKAFSPQKGLQIVVGELSNKKLLQTALKDHHVVISALGSRGTKLDDSMYQAIKTIVAVMERSSAKQLFFMTSFVASDRLPFFMRFGLSVLLKDMIKEKQREEKAITQSALSWTIIRPARMIDGEKTGMYTFGETISYSPFSSVSRADVADCILKLIESSEVIHKDIGIHS